VGESNRRTSEKGIAKVAYFFSLITPHPPFGRPSARCITSPLVGEVATREASGGWGGPSDRPN